MITEKQLSEQQVGVFATMPNTQAAFEYALRMARAEGMPEGLMTTAIMIYHNSLIEQLKGYTND